MSKKWKIVLIVLVALVLVFVLFKSLKGDSALQVKTEQSESRRLVETISGSGKIEPETEVKITSEISGVLIDLAVEEGQRVEKGDLLLKINPDLFQSALNRATASLNTARSNKSTAQARKLQAEAQFKTQQMAYSRSQNLLESGAISQAEYDNALAAFEVAKADKEASQESVNAANFNISSAQANVKEANDNLNRTTLYAPQSGVITALNIEEGESVLGTNMMQGTELMRVSDLSAMEVNVEVNETDIIRVNLGDTADIEVDAYLDKVFKGVVTEISNTANNAGMQSLDQVTNFDVKVRILESSYSDLLTEKSKMSTPFRPGMSATVEIQTKVLNNALTVPISAVTTRTDTVSMSFEDRIKAKREAKEENVESEPVLCVFVFEEGKAKLKAVETGIQDNRYIQITEGLSVGEEVITGPDNAVSKLLKPGSDVEKKDRSPAKEE